MTAAIGPILSGVSGLVNAFQARNAFKHRYQDTVKDMEAAGLNPALAYGQGGGNPQTNDIPDLGQAYNQSQATAANVRQTNLDTEIKRAQKSDLEAEAANKNAQAAAIASAANTKAMLDAQEWRFRGGEKENTGQTGNELRKLEMEAAINARNSGAALNSTNRSLLQLSFPQAQAEAHLYRDTGDWLPRISTAKDIFQGFMPRINFGGDRTFNTHNWNPPGRR